MGTVLVFAEHTNHSPNLLIRPHKCGVLENKAQINFCKASSCRMECKIFYLLVQQKILEKLKPLHTARIVILVVFPVE